MTSGYEHKNRRLIDWDYSASGVYFITFCTWNRAPILGRVHSCEDSLGIHAEFIPTRIGEECLAYISEKAKSSDDVAIENFVVMPNHVHLLVDVSRTSASPSSEQLRHQAIPRLVSSIKSHVTHATRQEGIGHHVWQRSFHDHIVRSEDELERIREYIENNPLRWELDKFYVR